MQLLPAWTACGQTTTVVLDLSCNLSNSCDDDDDEEPSLKTALPNVDFMRSIGHVEE